jgi:hypothetical protein
MSKTLDWVLMDPSPDFCPCMVCRQRRALRALVKGEPEIPDLYALRAAVIDLLGGIPDETVAGETDAARHG